MMRLQNSACGGIWLELVLERPFCLPVLSTNNVEPTAVLEEAAMALLRLVVTDSHGGEHTRWWQW